MKVDCNSANFPSLFPYPFAPFGLHLSFKIVGIQPVCQYILGFEQAVLATKFLKLNRVFRSAVFYCFGKKSNCNLFCFLPFQSMLSRLPAYLTVQFVRFYFKEKDAINAKILKVDYLQAYCVMGSLLTGSLLTGSC